MKTKATISIDETVMRRIKEKAAREGTTMSALIEDALRESLAPAPRKPAKRLPPLPGWHLGPFLVDILDKDALYEDLDEQWRSR